MKKKFDAVKFPRKAREELEEGEVQQPGDHFQMVFQEYYPRPEEK